jgi:hypothetical protein
MTGNDDVPAVTSKEVFWVVRFRPMGRSSCPQRTGPACARSASVSHVPFPWDTGTGW